LLLAKIILPDSPVLELEGVPQGWTWADLADALEENGELNEQQVQLIYSSDEANHIASGELFLVDIVEDNEVEEESLPIISNDEISNDDDIDKTGNYVPQRSEVVFTEEDNRPKVNLYDMSLYCSKNRKEWVATLSSEHKPIQANNNNSKGSHDRKRIYLILDDSGSMRSRNIFSQLKVGVSSFLRSTAGHEIAIEWFNSPCNVPISINSGDSHIHEIRRAVPKGGNRHNGCLENLIQNKPRLGSYRGTAPSNGDVILMFTDGKPNGKGLNVEKTARKLKDHQGVRIITIGCGGADPEFMERISSAESDHHRVEDISTLTATFDMIAKTLVQRKTSFNSPQKASAPAKQILSKDKIRRGLSSLEANQSLSSSEGFDYIQDFECYYCKNNQRMQCTACSKSHCGEGLSRSSKSLICPACGTKSQIEYSDRFVTAAGSSGGAKRK